MIEQYLSNKNKTTTVAKTKKILKTKQGLSWRIAQSSVVSSRGSGAERLVEVAHSLARSCRRNSLYLINIIQS